MQLSLYYTECQPLPSKIPFEINLEKVYLDVLEQKDLKGRIYQLS